MATAIIVEDGTGVTNANSYVSEAEVRTYAEDRGITVGTDSAVAILIFNAMDYMNAQYDERWVGVKTDDANALAWPRTGICMNGVDIPDDVIPNDIKQAQMILCMAVNSKITLYSNTAGGQAAIKSESVGRNAVSTEYFEPFYTAMVASIPQQAALLNKWLRALSLYMTRRI
jgi:hypothetical protein